MVQIVMKQIIFLALVFFTINSKADTPYPYGKEPEKYLNSKGLILFAVKVSGPLPPETYSEYFSYNVQNDKSSVADKWRAYAGSVELKYLVVNSIKGESVSPHDIITVKDIDNLNSTKPIGESFIIFLDREGDEYTLQPCDVADISMLSKEDISKLFSVDTKRIVTQLVSKHYMNCMEKSLPVR